MSYPPMHRPLLQLKRGDIAFEAFYIETKSDWNRLAAKQHRRMKHRLQGSADYDDILQEMLISIPESVETYDAEAGSMGLSSFVIWNAFAAAKDFINQQCGSYKGRTKEPSRAPTITSCLPVRDHVDADGSEDRRETMLQQMSAIDPDQEWAVSVRERRDEICETLVEHVVMSKLLEHGASVQAIAEAIYENEKLREELGLTTQQRTYGMVRRVTKRFVQRASCLA